MTPFRHIVRPIRGLVCCAVLMLPFAASAAPSFKVDGLGFIDDIRMQNLVKTLRFDDVPEDHFDVTYIENALFLMDSRLEGQGFLKPTFSLEITEIDGIQHVVEWHGEGLLDIPSDLQAERVRVQVDEGVFYHYSELTFTGLDLIPEEEARSYFYEERFLFFDRSEKVFYPTGMSGSAQALQSVLKLMGYQDAQVEASIVTQDDSSGDVNVAVSVVQGKQHMARTVRPVLTGYRAAPGVEGVELRTAADVNEPFSSVWRQDYGRAVLRRFYEAGYPEARGEFQVVQRVEQDNQILIDFDLKINPGPRVRVGDIVFDGIGRTQPHILEKRMELRSGRWLDPLQLERDRFAIAALGIYEDVDADYQPTGLATRGAPRVAPPVVTRDVLFEMKPGERISLDLLFGYGSYDQLRGGFEVSRNNLWGRAHRDSLLAVQSFVSTLVEYRYSMPEFFDINNSLNFRLRGLKREEVSFRREEIGAEVRVTRELQSIRNANVSLGYRIQRERALGLDSDEVREEARVGSIFGNFNINRLDNPIYPTDGYRLQVETEVGSKALAGEVDFQRLTIGGSYHYPLSSTTYFHAGLSHGLVAALNGDSYDIPVGQRFFLGGEDSIRGYREGEASPFDDNQVEVGAEAYALLQLELEQMVIRNLSVVFFTDALAQSRDLNDYLSDDFLLTVGLGLRYRTPIGPLRLEAGYNPVRRDNDPNYAIHLSLGYPF